MILFLEFECLEAGGSVAADKVCNGIRDCSDGTDESSVVLFDKDVYANTRYSNLNSTNGFQI